MHLIFRPARLGDLSACLACTRDRFVFDPPHQQLLLDMWRDLIAGSAASFWVMEDLEEPSGAEAAYFCVVAFVTDEFAARMHTTLLPYLALQVVKCWAAGDSPFLDLAGLRRANAEGRLRLVCLQSGFHSDYETSPAGREVLDGVLEMMTLSGRGYQVQECFFDTYNCGQRDWAERAGFRVCNDHAAFYAAQGDGSFPEQRACLYAVTRAEASSQDGTILATIFHSHPPRFGLRPPEQKMLLWALTGLTDDELAEELSVAKITVSKRWIRIYERVQEAAPEMFPTEARVGDQNKRGAEKRRRLLHYRRHHLEELRPYPLVGKRGEAEKR